MPLYSCFLGAAISLPRVSPGCRAAARARSSSSPTQIPQAYLSHRGSTPRHSQRRRLHSIDRACMRRLHGQSSIVSAVLSRRESSGAFRLVSRVRIHGFTVLYMYTVHSVVSFQFPPRTDHSHTPRSRTLGRAGPRSFHTVGKTNTIRRRTLDSPSATQRAIEVQYR